MKLSPEDNNGTEDSAQTDNNSHFNSSRPGSSGTNIRKQRGNKKPVLYLYDAGHPNITRMPQIIKLIISKIYCPWVG